LTNPIKATTKVDRIGSLDFLRGIAILGILVINIESFAYPDPWSPYKYGFDSAIDTHVRFWVYFFTQGKFFGMLTVLFGAGFFIFMERLEHKGLGLSGMDIYLRRLFVLFIIGVAHAYLIWDGDILYHYAACGFVLLFFRTWSIRNLLILIAVVILYMFFNTYQRTAAQQDKLAAYEAALQIPVTNRSEAEIEVVTNWEKRTQPKVASDEPIETPRNTIIESWIENAKHTKVHEGEVLYTGIFLRTMIMMILGVILYQTGVFSDLNAMKHYWLLTSIILLLAVFANYFRYYQWTYEYYLPVTSHLKASLGNFSKELMGLSYALVFNGAFQKLIKQKGESIIAKIGRMALTNYISQSIICAFLFYGFGLGWHGQFSRVELLPIIVVIWIFQLLFSYFWLKKYQYGPLEWVWRRFTYGV
jgi:uncharacterized protein